MNRPYIMDVTPDASIPTYEHADVIRLWQYAHRLEAEIERLRDAYTTQVHDIEQTLGQALGYPWYKDDQVNFCGATEADGVCVGEHVPETLAAEAAAEIGKLQEALSYLYADVNGYDPCDRIPAWDNRYPWLRALADGRA